MLRNCILPTSYEQTRREKRCGEIICYDDVNFTIICALCEIKLFEFDDFILHYQNVHLRGSDSDDGICSDGKLEVCIKSEERVSEERFNAWESVYDEQPPVRILGRSIKGNKVFKSTKKPTAVTAFSVNDSDYGQHDMSAGTNAFDREKDDEDDDGTNSDAEWKPTEEDENNHILKKTRKPKTYQCEQCHKFYSTERFLKAHVTIKHLRSKDYKCDQCDAKFSAKRLLDEHTGKEHNGFLCTQCNGTYRTRRSLREHKQRQHAVKAFKCDHKNCTKAFSTVPRLKIHKKTHSEERNIVCEICGFRTRKPHELIVHRRTHTGERPYQCSICERRFMSSSLLNEHQAMHSKERPHKCDVCGAAFARSKALYHHKFLHSDVKQFVCKLCGSAYRQMAGLAGHMRKHRAEGPTLLTSIG